MDSFVSSSPKARIFKNVQGTHYLQALFFETAIEKDKDYVLYTLKQEDHKGYPSLHRLYVEADDPLEYEFAKKYFASWTHWKMIKACNWFKPYYDAMKEELDLSIHTRALKELRESAEDPKNTVQVNKYLLDKGWEQKDDKRGRPSKKAIKEEADKMIKENDVVADDWGRIVNG